MSKNHKIKKDPKKIDKILSRSINAVYPSKKELKKALLSGEQLTFYNGIDPNFPHVHLGHAMNYFILKGFRDLGHKVVVLVGDFTAMIGDPTDKSATRPRLTKGEVKENLKGYKKQIGKILDFNNKTNPVEFKFNSTWLSKLSFEDVVEIASNFTVQHMLERDTFQKRMGQNKPLYLQEFLYPLMQGYDSVAMEVDGEVGGTDQLFNMLAGRTLVKRYLDKDKFVITHPLLENPKTGEILMSKSAGRGIFLDDGPKDMYGKVMSLPDEALEICFRYCTELELGEIKKILSSKKPKDVKMRLAKEIVSIYHTKSAAEGAEKHFKQVFSRGEMPKDAKEVFVKKKTPLIDILLEGGVIKSKSNFRRLVEQGAIRVLEEKPKKIEDEGLVVTKDTNLRVGKKRFVKIKIK